MLANAARDGWLWWLTPDEDLRLVHATARPAIPPRIAKLAAEPRTLGVATANLDGVLDVDGASTDKVELRAQWTNWVDDPASPGPVQSTIHEVVTNFRIGESERYSLLNLDPVGSATVGGRTVEVPIRIATHNLPDTKAHVVGYQLYGSSRFREFFAPDELPDSADPGSMGAVVPVNIPSSAAPAPPVVHDVIPMFQWEQVTEPEHPFAIQRTRRSGVRIWLDRPWFSSGDDEMLAIIVSGHEPLQDDNVQHLSLWARDPILVGAAIAYAYQVPVLTAWEERAVQLGLAPESLPGRPELHVVMPDTDVAEEILAVFDAYAYRPEFNAERNRWFVDAIFESAGVSWPFLRLAVARYQANSLPGLEFSKVVGTDFVQLPPERVGTLSRPDNDRVRITVSGVTAVTNAPAVEPLLGPPSDHDALVTLLTASHRVQATLQMRRTTSGSDLDWSDVVVVPAELTGADATSYRATWTAELPLPAAQQLQTPGSSVEFRVQIEEFEILSADPQPGQAALTATERLVYADHFPL